MTFDEFVGARLGPLLRYATVVTCDPHLAQDVVQEVLLRAQQRWRRIARVDQPEAYVKRMVLNEFLSWRRRVANRVLPMERSQLDRATPPAEDPARQMVERDALLARIAGLPPRQRAVIALRYYEGCTDVEIAQLLDCRVGTVRSHASRALATLRDGMAPPGWEARASASRATGDRTAPATAGSAAPGTPPPPTTTDVKPEEQS